MMPKRFRSDDGDEVNTMPVGGMRRNRAGLSSRSEMPVRPARPAPKIPETVKPSAPPGKYEPPSLAMPIVNPDRKPFNPPNVPLPPPKISPAPVEANKGTPMPTPLGSPSIKPAASGVQSGVMPAMKKGGKVASASNRADGIAKRGKTRGVMR